ncbi:capsular polysaccharide export protein, LipB/KpsS family [Chitinophaga niabensis]|uniref:Capsule polysaccharide biosynthesis protein n=1 Tax=Chitinophaga niabensis TaxID=536979 RepID=A0A1N6JXY6_9BACT|nr:hypothetical protein [Chitinophaga niabensis]SIO49079.1 Capsule polysaccharide biosynthesis protein [Chitinophaga niabensis]
MKVLFYNGMNITPHIETEMEIAVDLIKNKHEVYFTHCKGDLLTCCTNPSHVEWICRNCADKKKRAFQLIDIPKKNIIPYPKIVLDETIIPKSFASIDELKQFSYEGSDIGLGVASSLISEQRDHKLNTLLFNEHIQRGLRTALLVHKAGKKILDKVQPDEVVLFNGRFLDIRPFMRLCEQRNIKFYAHERGGTMNKYILCENSTPHSLTAIAKEIETLWGDGGPDKEEIGSRFFTDRRSRITQSWVVFTENQERGRLPEGFDRSKKNIVLYNSSMDEYEGIAGFSSRIYPNDNVGLLKLMESFQHEKNIHFYLRVHPNLKGLENSQVKELDEIGARFKNLTVIRAEEVVDTYSLLDAADIAVAFSSTMGIEASFWGKPVVLLGNAFYDQLNGFYKPSTHEEVVALLHQQLEPLPSKDILKYGYWELERGIYYKYYQPETLFTGKFMEQSVEVSKPKKVVNYLLAKGK